MTPFSSGQSPSYQDRAVWHTGGAGPKSSRGHIAGGDKQLEADISLQPSSRLLFKALARSSTILLSCGSVRRFGPALCTLV